MVSKGIYAFTCFLALGPLRFLVEVGVPGDAAAAVARGGPSGRTRCRSRTRGSRDGQAPHAEIVDLALHPTHLGERVVR